MGVGGMEVALTRGVTEVTRSVGVTSSSAVEGKATVSKGSGTQMDSVETLDFRLFPCDKSSLADG